MAHQKMTDEEYGEIIDREAHALFIKMKNDTDIAEIVIRAVEQFFDQNPSEWAALQDCLDPCLHNN